MRKLQPIRDGNCDGNDQVAIGGQGWGRPSLLIVARCRKVLSDVGFFCQTHIPTARCQMSVNVSGTVFPNALAFSISRHAIL